MNFRTTVLLPLALVACSKSEPGQPPADAPAPVVSVDFGILPHGAIVSRDLVIPVPRDGGAWFPVGFQRACTCADHEFVAIDGSGHERAIDGRPDAAQAIRDDERLLLRLTIDTNAKEPADLAPVPTPGQVVLRDLRGPVRQHFQRVSFTFGIDAPIAVRPYAHLDVGEVPRKLRYQQTLELVPDAKGVEFGDVHVVEPTASGEQPAPDVSAELEPDGAKTLLHVTVEPTALRPVGPFAVEIDIDTNVPLPAPPHARNGGEGPTVPAHYVLRIPVSGRVAPEIELSPPERFAMGKIDVGAPYEERLVVTDHDLSRSPEFVVVGIVDSDGRDVRDHFSLQIDPLASNPRASVLTLRYDGGLGLADDGRSPRKWLRGRVQLAKTPDSPVLLEIEFSAFART